MFVASRYGSLPNEHMVDCYYCRQVRSWFLHRLNDFGLYKMMECWRCQFTCRSYVEDGVGYRAWLCYPCGWWEEREDICECIYLDKLGNELRDEGRFCRVPRYDPVVQEMVAGDLYFIQTMTDLQIDDLFATGGWAEYRGLFHEQDGVELIYGFLEISDMVSIRPFRKIYPFAKQFVLNSLPKLSALRKKHLICKYLHWSEVQLLMRLNSSIRRTLGSEAVDVISLAEHLFSVYFNSRGYIGIRQNHAVRRV